MDMNYHLDFVQSIEYSTRKRKENIRIVNLMRGKMIIIKINVNQEKMEIV